MNATFLLLSVLAIQYFHAGSCSCEDINQKLFDLYDSLVEDGTGLFPRNYADGENNHREKLDMFKFQAIKTYMIHFKKNYSEEELPKRSDALLQTFLEIQSWNEQFRLGQVSYSQEVNEFADLTEEELASIRGFAPTLSQAQSKKLSRQKGASLGDDSLPTQVSWLNYFKGVKNQGTCGCCAAMATLDTVMAARAIQSNNISLVGDYSVQQIVDCDEYAEKGAGGCDGGTPEHALDYLRSVGKIADEKSYPYREFKGYCKLKYQSSQLTFQPVSASNEGPQYIELDSEELFKYHLAKTGPLIALMHTSVNFLRYRKGIFDDPDCLGQDFNHAVVVVGYNSEAGEDYWVLKNSHGSGWGEKGFMKIARGNNMCGIGKLGWVITKS